MRLQHIAILTLALLATTRVQARPVGQPPEPRAVVMANVDPAVLALPMPVAAPIIFGATLGIPRVITWAGITGNSGIAWGTTSAITAANAYVTYDGTNLIFNVPTGDSFAWKINGVATTLPSSSIPDPYVPTDALMNVTGGITATGVISADNYRPYSTGGDLFFQDTEGNYLGKIIDFGSTGGAVFDTFRAFTLAANIVFQDSGGNTLATLFDDGTTGRWVASATSGATLSMSGAGVFDGDLRLNGGAGAITFGTASSTTVFTTSHLWKDAAGNTMATLTDNGTDGVFTVGNLEAAGIALSGADGYINVPRVAMTGATLRVEDPNGNVGPVFTDVGTTIDTALDGRLIVAGATSAATFSATGAGVFDGDLRLNGGTGAITFAAGETLVPEDASLNVTGNIVASGYGQFGSGAFIFPSGSNLYIQATPNISMMDPSGNFYATFYDDGTTGSMQLTGTKSRGQVVMNADNTTAATVTVNSGAICVVADQSAVTATPAFSVTTTVLTITNSAAIGGTTVNYICL